MGLKYKVEVNGISNWLKCGDTIHELDHFVLFSTALFSLLNYSEPFGFMLQRQRQRQIIQSSFYWLHLASDCFVSICSYLSVSTWLSILRLPILLCFAIYQWWLRQRYECTSASVYIYYSPTILNTVFISQFPYSSFYFRSTPRSITYILEICILQQHFFLYSCPLTSHTLKAFVLHILHQPAWYDTTRTHDYSVPYSQKKNHRHYDRFTVRQNQKSLADCTFNDVPLSFLIADRLCFGPATFHDLIDLFYPAFFCFLPWYILSHCPPYSVFCSFVLFISSGQDIMDIPSLSFSWPSLPSPSPPSPIGRKDCLIAGITFRCRYYLYD